MDSDCSVPAKSVEELAHAYAHARASESVESLSASSSAASDQNFLTPTLHDLLLIFLVPTPLKTDAMDTLGIL